MCKSPYSGVVVVWAYRFPILIEAVIGEASISIGNRTHMSSYYYIRAGSQGSCSSAGLPRRGSSRGSAGALGGGGVAADGREGGGEGAEEQAGKGSGPKSGAWFEGQIYKS